MNVLPWGKYPRKIGPLLKLIVVFGRCGVCASCVSASISVFLALHSTHTAIVSQEPVLFACSIEDNIRYGIHGREVPKEEIIRAAQDANAHQFIMEFPDGYDTFVGERGVQLSGGQKQRVAIARALLMAPQILILDEVRFPSFCSLFWLQFVVLQATSALDAESERLVDLALRKLMKGRTVLLIAHRFSTVRSADQIIVLSKGKIIEKGTHVELIANKEGFYSFLFERQLKTGSEYIET